MTDLNHVSNGDLSRPPGPTLFTAEEIEAAGAAAVADWLPLTEAEVACLAVLLRPWAERVSRSLRVEYVATPSGEVSAEPRAQANARTHRR